jgi:hemerythrin superfamily protein
MAFGLGFAKLLSIHSRKELCHMGLTDNMKEIAKNAKNTVVSALDLGGDERDVLHVMKRDHQLVEGMIDSLMLHANKSGEQVQGLVESLVSEIRLHSKSEEDVVYDACRRQGKDLRSFALEGFHEHHLVDELCDDLMKKNPGPDGEFCATLTVLKEILDHHIREEEGSLFAKLRREFDEEELLEMGRRMESEKQRLHVDPESTRVDVQH